MRWTSISASFKVILYILKILCGVYVGNGKPDVLYVNKYCMLNIIIESGPDNYNDWFK